MVYEFEVEGKIVGKERPRVNLYNGIVYTPNKTKDYENYIRECFAIKYPNYVPLEGRVSITIIAYRKIPTNTNKATKEKMLSGDLSPTIKPDVDNITKSVLDAMNKIAFLDDNQVCKTLVEKKYSVEEKLYIKIEDY